MTYYDNQKYAAKNKDISIGNIQKTLQKNYWQHSKKTLQEYSQQHSKKCCENIIRHQQHWKNIAKYYQQQSTNITKNKRQFSKDLSQHLYVAVSFYFTETSKPTKYAKMLLKVFCQQVFLIIAKGYIFCSSDCTAWNYKFKKHHRHLN